MPKKNNQLAVRRVSYTYRPAPRKERPFKRLMQLMINMFVDLLLWFERTWFMDMLLKMWSRVNAIYTIGRLWFTDQNKIYAGTTPAQLTFYGLSCTLGVLAYFWSEPTKGVSIYIFVGFLAVWLSVPRVAKWRRDLPVKRRVSKQKGLNSGTILVLWSSRKGPYKSTARGKGRVRR